MTLINPDANCNALKSMLDAVVATNDSLTQQQITDTQTTLSFGKFESAINNYWYGDKTGKLNQDIASINSAVNNGDSNSVTAASSQFSTDSALAQSLGSNADSLVQSSNSMVSTDSTNIQTLSQLSSMMNTFGFVANLLSK